MWHVGEELGVVVGQPVVAHVGDQLDVEVELHSGSWAHVE